MSLDFPLSKKKFASLAQAMAALNPEITNYEIRSQKRQYIITRAHSAFHYFQRTRRGAGLVELAALVEDWVRGITRKAADDRTDLYYLLRDQHFHYDWLKKQNRTDLFNKLDIFRDVRNRATHDDKNYPAQDELETAFYYFLQFAELYCRVTMSKNLFSEPSYEKALPVGYKFCDRFEIIELLFDLKTTKTYKVWDRHGHQDKVYTLKWVSIFADDYQQIIRNETQYRPLFNDNPNIGHFYASFEEIPSGEILLLEYIDAWTLEQWINEHLQRRLDSHSFYQLIYLWGGVLNALRDIHRRGYVHGSLTQQHILVTRDTKDAKVVTFDKCSPWKNKQDCAKDTCTLAETIQQVLNHCTDKPALPASLLELMRKATSKDSSDWYPDADAMYTDWVEVYNDVRYHHPRIKFGKIALISCSNRKKPGIWPAEELYSMSPSFNAALKYAKDPTNSFSDHFIVSGRYGLVGLRQELPVYDFDLRELSFSECTAWATNIASSLKKYFDPASSTVSILCDDFYSQHLSTALTIAGFSVERVNGFFQSVSTTAVSKEKEGIPMPSREDFIDALTQQFAQVQDDSLIISSGELHRIVGGYPGTNHRMPMCCSVMKAAIQERDTILKEPQSGLGASLTIKFQLPR